MKFILCIAVLSLILLISYKKNNTLISINVLFTSMWCICLGISSLGLYGIYIPSNIVFILSFFTIIIFNLTYFFTSKKFQYDRIKNSVKKKEDSIHLAGKFNVKILYLLNGIAYIYSIPFIPKAINIIENYGYSNLRNYAFDSSTLMATTEQLLIFQWIISPLFITTVLVTTVLMSQKKRVRTLVAISIIDIAFYTFLFGGRYMIVKSLMFCFFSFLFVNQKKFLNIIKTRKKPLLIGVILIVVLISLTNNRGFENKGFIGNTVIYYTGSFTYLSELIKIKSWEGSLLWGTATFGFIVNFIFLIITVLFGVDFNGSNHIITQITQYNIMISDSVPYNSMATMLFPFLMDFGYTGIIFSTMIYAYFATKVENYYYKKKTIFSLSLYVFMSFTIFDSVMSYSFISPGTMFSLLFLILVSFKVKYKGEIIKKVENK